MKGVVAAIGVLVAGMAGPSFAKEADCPNPYVFQWGGRLSLDAISAFGESSTVSDANRYIEVYPFNDETGPQKGKLFAVAVVIVGYGDGLGAPVGGGVLWAREHAWLDGAASKALNRSGQDLNAVFLSNPDDDKAGCPRSEYRIKLDRKDVVTGNGAVLGHIKPFDIEAHRVRSAPSGQK